MSIIFWKKQDKARVLIIIFLVYLQQDNNTKPKVARGMMTFKIIIHFKLEDEFSPTRDNNEERE